MRMIERALLVAGAAGLLCGFAPASTPVMVDGHLPLRTEVRYGFGCAFGRIDIGFAEQMTAKADADRVRTLQLLAFGVSGRAISADALADVAKLLRSYERIEAVSAECGAEETASLHLRGLRKTDWQAHIAALEAHDGAPAGTPRPERPASFTATITIAPSGRIEIEG